jgi:hypothetical protein
MERTPVVVENFKCLCEADVRLTDLVFHIERLHQYAVELDGLSVQWVCVLQGLACELLCEDPLLPVEVDLAKVSLCLGIGLVAL